MTTHRNVAFVGLGAMGLPMATNLARNTGARLAVFDTSESAMSAASDLGRPASSLADAVSGADVVITMLPADANLRQVVDELTLIGRAGQILLDFSTVHPATIERAAEALARRGVPVVSATCMKSVTAAWDADLTLFVGSDSPGVVAGLQSLFNGVSSLAIDVGSARAAKVLKIINNLQTASLNLALSEALVLAGRIGCSYEETADELLRRGLGGWTLRNHIVGHVVPNDLGPGRFPVRYMAKDVRLASQLVSDIGQPRFLCGPLLAAYRGAASLGYLDHYHPIIVRWLELCAGSGGPAEPASDINGALDVVAGWVSAAEFLIASHGLRAAAATGSDPVQAAGHLAEASAGTKTMQRFAGGDDHAGANEAESVLSQLEESLELAQKSALPALTMELAHDYAVTLVNEELTRST